MKLPKFKNSWGCENNFLSNKILIILFYADNLLKTLEAVKTLNFSGFALSMPFKVEILKYTDYIDPIANEIGSANTILNISDNSS